MTTLLAAAAIAWIAAGIAPVPGQGPVGMVEIHGVAAGPFQRAAWAEKAPHFVADRRHPLLAPREEGAYRNIYAPSAVETPEGWRLFYGAWDGVHTGNDRIYSTATTNWLTFGPRDTVIEHGPFIHVCNVSAIAGIGGGFELMCTTYPDANGLNKPARFVRPDGAAEPHVAAHDDLVTIAGYPPFAEADINGMNVIVRDGDAVRLFFNDFANPGRTFRATQAAGRRFDYEGVALEARMMVNDVKIFPEAWLMGLHRNGQALWYALSDDGKTFAPPVELFAHRDEADKYIVAVGWVVQGDRLLGALYGAGAVPELHRNRIFARWLQKKAVFVSGGVRYEPREAMGPDRQFLHLPAEAMTGTLEIYSEDGATLIASHPDVTLKTGHVYRLEE